MKLCCTRLIFSVSLLATLVLVGCKKTENNETTVSEKTALSQIQESDWVMKAGSWQIEGEFSILGQKTSNNLTVCEPNDASLLERATVFDASEAGCQLVGTEIKGPQLTYRLECTGTGASTEGMITALEEDSFKREEKTIIQAGSETIERTSSVTYKRLGECNI